MERDNQESQKREVAVKKLTRQASERNYSLYEDFKNELEIMKVSKHNFYRIIFNIRRITVGPN